MVAHGKPTISIMVWGAIWAEGRSKLVFLERDEESARHGYTARSYIRALEEGLLPGYDKTRLFQQDNAKIHKAKATMDWMEEHEIDLWDWPPHSPDLNPIEHVWAWMKRYLRRKYPDQSSLGRNEDDIEIFKARIVEAWEAVPQALILKLIEGLPSRCRAIRRANGWYTRF